MDDIVAEIKKLLEAADPKISVVEFIPEVQPEELSSQGEPLRTDGREKLKVS